VWVEEGRAAEVELMQEANLADKADEVCSQRYLNQQEE
jgi:hypothetical protein